VLASKTPDDGIRRALSPQRAAGYNHVLAHESGELYSVEVSARRFAILYGEDGFIVHTNNYLSETMQELEREPEELIASRVRYHRALRLIKREKIHTIKTLQAIQRDHVNFSNSICNHAVNVNNPLDREKTVNAIVIDLTTREMHIAWGNPCKNPYHTYHLDA
jgi:isopenicillin-N N-acyltransferase-like protein